MMSPEERALLICKDIEDQLANIGIITTIHYEKCRLFISDQIHQAEEEAITKDLKNSAEDLLNAEKRGAEKERERCVKIVQEADTTRKIEKEIEKDMSGWTVS